MTAKYGGLEICRLRRLTELPDKEIILDREKMKNTEWESFESVLTSKHFEISSWGPLDGPVQAFSIRRDATLKIMLETISNGSSTTTAEEIPAGTVRQATEIVSFVSALFGGAASAIGVIPLRSNVSIQADASNSVKVETATAQIIKWSADGERECIYTIDWLENVPSSFIWPDYTETKLETSLHKTFKSSTCEIVMHSSEGAGENNRGCVHLVIDGIDIFFGRSVRVEMEHIKSPGYILYRGKPTEVLRERLINALSFAFGAYLVYLGHTSFDKDWHAVGCEAVSPSTLGGAATRLMTAPPSPMGMMYRNEINPALLQRFVDAIFGVYDSYNLRGVFWGYWHAIAAPVHMASVHFGAVIEGLQASFFKKEKTASKELVAADIWQSLSAQFVAEIEKTPESAEGKRILANKLKELNVAPQSVLMERFLGSLKIEMGEVEEKAWRNGRNRAAHGRKIRPNQYVSVIRENKALQVLSSRIILAISKSADSYHDYYSLKNPIRPLAVAIPDDSQTGRI